MMQACTENDTELLEQRLQCPCDPNLKFARLSPLLLATTNGNLERVRLLLEAGADTNLTTKGDGRSLLYAAAQQGHLQMVRSLLVAGADKTLTARHDSSPFRVTAQNGYAAVASVLRLSRKRTWAMVED
eukprot:Skav207125  [mRNA]  locus=scaffold1369:323723:324109:- [translate_table: standard]